MRAKSKVIMAITILLLVSTVMGVLPVKAVKSGERIKIHMRGEGADIWDSPATVLIKANVEHDYVSSWLDKGDFKKTIVDPITGEEVMLIHGRIKEGEAFFLEWWQGWNSVWIITGTGVVKTQTNTYSTALITLIFCVGSNWAWAGFEDPESGDSGPFSPFGEWGTLTILTKNEENGIDQFGALNSDRKKILHSLITNENRIHRDAEVSAAETNYLIVAIGQTESERKAHLWDPPYSWTIDLDSDAVELSSFWWHDKEGEIIGESVMWQVFYHIYEPFSLGYGWHDMYNEISFYEGIGQEREQIVMQWSNGFSVW